MYNVDLSLTGSLSFLALTFLDALQAIDFATLAVYTCERSCDDGGNSAASGDDAYVEEFVYRQPPAEM